MKRMAIAAIAAIALVLAAHAAGEEPVFVWIEGEAAVRNNLKANPWLKGDNAKLLSGGDALACLNERNDLPKPAYVLYKFEAPEEGDYHLYVRHGYAGHLGQMRYRLIELGADGKPVKKPGAEEGWIAWDADVAVVDQKPIGQHRTIEWSRHEPVELKKAAYYLDLQVVGPHAKKTEANPPVWTVIDAICLAKEPFTPSGFLKPGEKAGGQTEDGGDDDYLD